MNDGLAGCDEMRKKKYKSPVHNSKGKGDFSEKKKKNFSLWLLFEALRIEVHVDESQRTDENITQTHLAEAPRWKRPDYFTTTTDIGRMET